ncbi:MAG TPA: DUF501 domain-containing protein [Actinomycetota bacterium]|nr:DUF501 domain-containing protein [Actinomycetota bacterium]
MDDRAIVAVQLGRDPRGTISVVSRCPFDLPLVIRTSARLDDGSPFPTLYYLTCPVAVREIGRMEASGAMRDMEAQLENDEQLRAAYVRAHERYIAQRDGTVVADEAVSAGGMPSRVKCLHALYAHERADGNPVGAIVRERIEPLDCPGPCVEDVDGRASPTRGHPGFAGKKRRR